MAQIPGSVPLTGKVAPTDSTDTFATHVDIYGEGGYMSVTNTTERNAITQERRKLGMAVCTTGDNKIYTLTTNPATAGTVDGDWTEVIGGSLSKLQEVFDEGTTSVPAIFAALGYTTNDPIGVLPSNSIAMVSGDLVGFAGDGSHMLIGLPAYHAVNLAAKMTSNDPDHGAVSIQGANNRGAGTLKVGDGTIALSGDEMGTPTVGDVLVCASVSGDIGELEWQSINATLILDDTAISQLYTDPQVVIAAPGAGKFIQVHSVAAKFTYGTAQITGETQLAVWEGAFGNAALFQANLLGSATSTFTQISPEDGTLVENSALSVSNGDSASADPTMNGSTSTVKLYVNYSIITI